VLATFAEEPDLTDFTALVDALRDRGEAVQRLAAPAIARRVSNQAELAALEELGNTSPPTGDLAVEAPGSVPDHPR
jgi:hypothetical protein